jgi:hypothetical protein
MHNNTLKCLCILSIVIGCQRATIEAGQTEQALAGQEGTKMKIYSFFSGDTIFITKSRSLKKAQKVGREIKQTYINNCKYLDEEPEELVGYFIPEELEEISTSEARRLIKTDKDIFVLEDDLEAILTA